MHGTRRPRRLVARNTTPSTQNKKSTKSSKPKKSLKTTTLIPINVRTITTSKTLSKSINSFNFIRQNKLNRRNFGTKNDQNSSNSPTDPQIVVTTPEDLQDVNILPHNPEEGIPCNFIELPSTSKHPATVKPWSIMTFTDNLPPSISFETVQQQTNFYLENGGRVLKLYPGYEPYIFESIATQCSMRGINPDDLTLILPISAHEIKSGMYPHNHPTHPHFFTKQDKINYVREHCPNYVPHRRGFFVHKIIQQLTTKLDGINIVNTLNLPIEKLYDDYPDNYDPREGGFITTKSGNTLSHNSRSNTTTIKLNDFSQIDPMDSLATQELPEGHLFKKNSYDNNALIGLPSGRYPADRLRDKVYQVTSHLGSESVDLVVLNELEHIHQEHMSNVYDLILESFFQCELLVLDGKTRGYGLSSRLISTHYSHDHYVSPYKLVLLANFCAELAKLYKGLPTKDPYFHPQQVRMLLDICTGAVLPPKSVVDDMYGDFKDDFMAKYSKKKKDDGLGDKNGEKSGENNTGNIPINDNNTKTLEQIYSQLKQNMESQGMTTTMGVSSSDNDAKNNKMFHSKMDKMSDYFAGALQPLRINETLIESSPNNNLMNNEGDDGMNGQDGNDNEKSKSVLSLSSLFGNKTKSSSSSSQLNLDNKLSSVPIGIDSYEFQQLSTEQKLVKKQFEALDQQLGIVLEAKRLTMLANGSTAEDRLRLQQKQQILLDNHMLLPEDVTVVSSQTLDKLYSTDSKYTLIDNPHGERGKYKDLLAAKRVLAMKGEGLSDIEIKKLENAKTKLKKLLADQGADGVEALIDKVPEGEDGDDGDVLRAELRQITNDSTIDKLLQDELKKANDDITNEANKNKKKIINNNNNLDDDNDSKINKTELETTLDSLYDQELFVIDDLYDDSTTNNNDSSISTTDINYKGTGDDIDGVSKQNNIQKSSKLAPIPKDRVNELLNPQHRMTSQEEYHFNQLQEQLDQNDGDDGDNDGDDATNVEKLHDNIDSSTSSNTNNDNSTYSNTINTIMLKNNEKNNNKNKNPLALTTNFNNFKYYNPYAIISKDKLRSEMLELQLMQSLQKLMPNDDVKALVKGATQYFEKIQQEITISASKRLAIAKLDHFFEQSLLFKQKQQQQNRGKSGNNNDNFNDIESLMMQVRPKMISNWEQWKKGERKRQFQQEVAMALEREYGNLFQNIIYKTIVNSNPDFLQENEQDGDEGEGRINEVKMPKLKLGQLFQTDTFNRLYSLITKKPMGSDDAKGTDKGGAKSAEQMDPVEVEKMKEMYDMLTMEQQEELQRIALYIPVYTSTGILPLFPASTIKKHHDLREDLIVTEMKRQVKVQSEFIMKQKNEKDEKNNNNQSRRGKKKSKKPIGFNKLFDPDYKGVLKSDGLLTQDITWYNDEYVPLWMCNKRQSRLLLVEPEVNVGNYTFTTQRTHPVPTSKSQWKRYKHQQQGIEPLSGENNDGETNNNTTKPLSDKEKNSLYHIDIDNMTLITPHQYTIQQGMLVTTQNTFDVTIDDRVIRLQDHPTVSQGTQQQLNEYLSHSLSYLRTIERSYPYQARDSLAKNLPPVLSVSTAQLLQMELPHIITLPELENVLYHRLLPQIQGAVNILQSHQEFEQFASQLAVAGEKTKGSAEACILAYNTPIVSTAERSISHLHNSLKILESISMQLLWINLGLGFDSVGLPTATLSGLPTVYLQHILMREEGGNNNDNNNNNPNAGHHLRQNYLATNKQQGNTANGGAGSINYVNQRDITNLEPLSRSEALSVLHNITINVIPMMKKKLSDLQQHLQSTPYSRQQSVALATSERLHLVQSNMREFHMISSSSGGDSGDNNSTTGSGDGDGTSKQQQHTQYDVNGNPIDKKLLETNPQYRRYQQELEISRELQDIYKINPFIPAELSLDPKFAITTRSENQLLLLQYDNIHALTYTKAAQH